jgi:hypothetical protein
MRFPGEARSPVITVELKQDADRRAVGLVSAAIGAALDRTVGRGNYTVTVDAPTGELARLDMIPNAAGGWRHG